MTVPDTPTARLFFPGAGFTKPAGLPLAAELLAPVRGVGEGFFRAEGYSHLEHALKRYEQYLADVAPGKGFDLEERTGGLDREVTFAEPAPDMHADIDAAYHSKYDQYGPKIVGTVVGPEAARVSIKLVPRTTGC